MADFPKNKNVGVFRPKDELISFSENSDRKIQNGGTRYFLFDSVHFVNSKPYS